MAGKIYVARSSTFLQLDGREVQIRAGVTRVREGHALLAARPDLFDELHVHYDVEDSRRAPQDEPKPQPVKVAAAEEHPEKEPTVAPAAPAPRPQRGPRKTGA